MLAHDFAFYHLENMGLLKNISGVNKNILSAHRQAMFVRKRRKYEKELHMPLFLCYNRHWTLQRKLRDGEEREHKSEREEEGEEADGIEDEFGVSFS